METIFDFNPTRLELEAIGIDSLNMSLRHGLELPDPITSQNYIVLQEHAIFDIALLLEHRKEQEKADKYWNQIPEKHLEFLLGFDFGITAK